MECVILVGNVWEMGEIAGEMGENVCEMGENVCGCGEMW